MVIQMSGKVGNFDEEVQQLRRRIENLETSFAQMRKERVVTGEEGIGLTIYDKPRIDDLFRWQQNIPRIMDYDIWSIMLAKKQGTEELKSGIYAGGGDYAKITDLSPEDASSLAGALAHPARVLILRECERASQYASDLEKRVSAKYGALYHHIDSLIEANLLVQEKERGKYIITSAGKTALMFLNILASIINSMKAPPVTGEA